MSLTFINTKQATVSLFTFTTNNKYINNIHWYYNGNYIDVEYKEEDGSEIITLNVPVDAELGSVDAVTVSEYGHKYAVVLHYNIY